ncbi:CENPBD1 [Cordylochernes scorpioides]|uniref:CENPBD1 n=1 Tax=Cordylochernes scorpioides TaxID=51811 RepID=A0ABY6LXH3_9ARAC|nr:CENPBD1 [Cordylochernes scorpioides]
MDQGVISTFKSYYHRRTFKLLLSETDGQDKPTMLEFWKKFSIMKAIKIISDSWVEVKQPSCMNGVWRKIWPECVHRSAAEVDGTPAVRHEISNLARESNFEGMEETDINDLLTSNNQEFSNKELLQLELHFANEEDDSNRLIEISKEQNLTSKQISKAICLIDEAMEIFFKNDPDSGRSLKVSRRKFIFTLRRFNLRRDFLERNPTQSECHAENVCCPDGDPTTVADGALKVEAGEDAQSEMTLVVSHQAGDDTYAFKVQKGGDDTGPAQGPIAEGSSRGYTPEAGEDAQREMTPMPLRSRRLEMIPMPLKVQKGGDDTGPAQGSWSPLQRGPAEDLHQKPEKMPSER